MATASPNWPPDNFWQIACDMERSSTPGTLSMWPPKRKRWRTDGAVNTSSQTLNQATNHITSTKPTHKNHHNQQWMEHHPWTRDSTLRPGTRDLTSLPLTHPARSHSISTPGHGHGFQAMMSLLDAKSRCCRGDDFAPLCRWLLDVPAGAAWFWPPSCSAFGPRDGATCHDWLAMSIKNQALESMELQHLRTYESQAANRELRGSHALLEAELDFTRAQLEEPYLHFELKEPFFRSHRRKRLPGDGIRGQIGPH